MPNTPSAKADLRKSRVRRQVNRGRKSSMRTAIKNIDAAIEAGNLEAAEAQLILAQKLIDKNIQWNQIHANTGARRKSHLQKAVNELRTNAG